MYFEEFIFANSYLLYKAYFHLHMDLLLNDVQYQSYLQSRIKLQIHKKQET